MKNSIIKIWQVQHLLKSKDLLITKANHLIKNLKKSPHKIKSMKKKILKKVIMVDHSQNF